MPPGMEEDEREVGRSRAVREAQMAARLRHPNVVGVYDSTVPSGYYRFTNCTGFSIAVPVGWQIQHVGHDVYVRDPADAGIFLLIDQSGQPKPNPLADWQQQAAARQGSYPDYNLIRLAAVSYPQAEAAADWQFTYDRNGVEVDVLNRNVLANAHHAYALYWSTPVSDWMPITTTSRPLLPRPSPPRDPSGLTMDCLAGTLVT